MSRSTRTRHNPESYPTGLPIKAHQFVPERRGGRRRGSPLCKCGLPEINRVHDVNPVPPMETRGTP